MAFNPNDWYNSVKKENTLFAYRGSISSEKIGTILDSVDKKLSEKNESNKLKRKFYNVLVESLQNIYHHAEPVDAQTIEFYDEKEMKESKKFGMLILNPGTVGYKVILANFIKKHKLQMLKDRVDQLNALNSEEIKALYKLVLNNHEFSNKGGGGLGIIDIVKRTESKLDIEVFPFNQEYSFCSININVC